METRAKAGRSFSLSLSLSLSVLCYTTLYIWGNASEAGDWRRWRLITSHTKNGCFKIRDTLQMAVLWGEITECDGARLVSSNTVRNTYRLFENSFELQSLQVCSSHTSFVFTLDKQFSNISGHSVSLRKPKGHYLRKKIQARFLPQLLTPSFCSSASHFPSPVSTLTAYTRKSAEAGTSLIWTGNPR
jgi:hypothetical protein